MLTVSCLDLIQAKNFFVSLEWPGSAIEIFSGSPAYPESPIALFPLRILKYKEFFPICFFLFCCPSTEYCHIMLTCGMGTACPHNFARSDGYSHLICKTGAVTFGIVTFWSRICVHFIYSEMHTIDRKNKDLIIIKVPNIQLDLFGFEFCIFLLGLEPCRGLFLHGAPTFPQEHAWCCSKTANLEPPRPLFR